MFKKNVLASVIAASVMLMSVDSFAAFGGSRASSSGVGISRSSTVSKPSTTYSAPTTRTQSRAYNTSQPRTQVVEKHYYNNTPNYGNNGYNNSGNSFGRDVAATALGVGAGVLAAEAIQNLIAGPNGTYTHPQHPGVYYNQQGVPVEAPAVPAQMQPQASPVIIQQAQEKEGGFFSFLWGALGNILHLVLFVGVVGTLSYGAYKLYKLFKRKKDVLLVDFDNLKDDIDYKAQELFYDFQHNANNVEFIERNSKYLNAQDILSPACKVVQYSHEVVDVSAEAGKIRATVHYVATVREIGAESLVGDEKVNQLWHYERSGDKWILVGVEAA